MQNAYAQQLYIVSQAKPMAAYDILTVILGSCHRSVPAMMASGTTKHSMLPTTATALRACRTVVPVAVPRPTLELHVQSLDLQKQIPKKAPHPSLDITCSSYFHVNWCQLTGRMLLRKSKLQWPWLTASHTELVAASVCPAKRWPIPKSAAAHPASSALVNFLGDEIYWNIPSQKILI